jgi:DNA repair protein RadC
MNDRNRKLIQRALKVMESEVLPYGDCLNSPSEVRDYLRLRMHGLEHEVFVMIHLNSQHQVISCEQLFRGTLGSASIYPREVVKSALSYNSAAVILAHNHPSGVAEPSQDDITITRRIIDALGTVDIRVLDHMVVGHEVVSFAERGMI